MRAPRLRASPRHGGAHYRLCEMVLYLIRPGRVPSGAAEARRLAAVVMEEGE